MNELRHLLHEGIVYRGQVLKIASVTFVCDAPAKAAMTKIVTQWLLQLLSLCCEGRMDRWP